MEVIKFAPSLLQTLLYVQFHHIIPVQQTLYFYLFVIIIGFSIPVVYSFLGRIHTDPARFLILLFFFNS